MIPASLNTMMISAQQYWFDTFPTPQIACSLRQLNPNATNCLLVSTAGGSNSTIIGFSNGIVDISAINSYISTYGSCVVERWYNQNLSSSISSMANSTPAQRPIINPSLYTENGYPCLFFDGVNDWLQMFTGSVFTNLTLPSTYTILMTSRNRNATANQGIGMLFSRLLSTGSSAGLLTTFLGFNYLGDTVQGSSQIQSTEDTKVFASFLGSRLNSTARKISVNGVDEATSSSVYTVAGIIDSLGGYAASPARYSSANTTELIYYDTDVQSFHSAMQANQQAAWGIT